MPSPLPSNTVIAALPTSARRSTRRPAEASGLRQLARLDQVNQHVPLVLLQDREVPGFTDADLVALDGDFRAVDARWAERHLQAVHFVSSLSSSRWRVRCVGTRPLRPSRRVAIRSAGRAGYSGRSCGPKAADSAPRHSAAP